MSGELKFCFDGIVVFVRQIQIIHRDKLLESPRIRKYNEVIHRKAFINLKAKTSRIILRVIALHCHACTCLWVIGRVSQFCGHYCFIGIIEVRMPCCVRELPLCGTKKLIGIVEFRSEHQLF